MSLASRWSSYKLRAKLALGLAQYGRTAPVEEPQGGNEIAVKLDTRHATIAARVYRKSSDSWEDLGIIADGAIVVTPEYLDELGKQALS